MPEHPGARSRIYDGAPELIKYRHHAPQRHGADGVYRWFFITGNQDEARLGLTDQGIRVTARECEVSR